MLKMFIRPVGLFCLHRVNSCSDVTEVMFDFILLRSFFKVVWWLLISSAHFTNSTLKSRHRVQTGPNKSFSHSVVYIFLNLVHAVNKLSVPEAAKDQRQSSMIIIASKNAQQRFRKVKSSTAWTHRHTARDQDRKSHQSFQNKRGRRSKKEGDVCLMICRPVAFVATHF